MTDFVTAYGAFNIRVIDIINGIRAEGKFSLKAIKLVRIKQNTVSDICII